MKQDWRDLGIHICDIVQDAINSQDFRKLNQTIKNTIGDAVDSVAEGFRAGGGRGAQVHSGYGRRRHSGTGGSGTGSRQGKGFSAVSGFPALFAGHQTALARAGGTALSICGGILGVGTGLALAILGVLSLSVGHLLGFTIAGGILLPLFGAGAIMSAIGSGKCSMVRRFHVYATELRGRTYCDIKDLAKAVKKSRGFVVKDVRRMIEKGWFLQGHLDDGETCLIVDNATYAQYRATMKQAEALEVDKERREEQAKWTAQADKSAEERGKEARAGEETAGSRLTPEAEAVVKAGRTYVQKIRACNDAIPGEEISGKISRMELVIARIFERVERHPENVEDIEKLMEYYLPTTVKLLEAYAELSAQPVQGENIRSSQREIEATLDTLNEAFERLFDSLFQETMWDVSTDISVLKTLLTQEGLSADSLTRSGQSGQTKRQETAERKMAKNK
ncbi:MAG: hypothetical protein HFI63_07760 [Lachnospiraceae bacterium]|nr:hypothetical protein [Lachnospiraceae bacterium]